MSNSGMNQRMCITCSAFYGVPAGTGGATQSPRTPSVCSIVSRTYP